MTVHANPLRSASHASMFAHLAGPFTGGAADNVVELDATGAARVDWPARQPLLLVSLRQSAVTEPVRLRVEVAQSSGEVVEPIELEFARHSEAGSSLLAYRPGPASMVLDAVTPFNVTVSFVGGGNPAALRTLVAIRVVEGNLGRLLYVVGAEKMRLRRAAAELEAGRRLVGAAGDALDRAGADLGVLRLDARLAWDDTFNSPTIEPEREDDEPYRVRLSLYRPVPAPDPSCRRRAAERPRRRSDPGPAVGFRRDGSLHHRRARHRARGRHPPGIVAGRRAALRDARRGQADVPRPARRRRAFDPPAAVVRARRGERPPSPSGGEPGLPGKRERGAGAGPRAQSRRALPPRARCAPSVEGAAHAGRRGRSRSSWESAPTSSRFPAAELDAVAANLGSSAISADPGDTDTPALLTTLTPRPSTEDPDGHWLLDACGVKTFHRLAPDSVYLLRLPVHGLVMNSAPVGDRVGSKRAGTRRATSAGTSSSFSRSRRPTPPAPPRGCLDRPSSAATRRASPGPGCAAQRAAARRARRRAPQHDDHAAGDVGCSRRACAGAGRAPRDAAADAALAAGLVASDPGSIANLVSIVKLLRDGGAAALMPLALSDGRVLSWWDRAPGRRDHADGPLTHVVPVAPGSLVGHGGSLARRVGGRNDRGPASAGSPPSSSSHRGGAARTMHDAASIARAGDLAARGALLSLPQYGLVMNLLDRATRSASSSTRSTSATASTPTPTAPPSR